MRTRVAAVVAATSLFGAAAAKGNVFVSAVLATNQPAAIDPALSGYSAYILQLTNTSGLPITAIDLSSGNRGIFGQFFQRWTFDVDSEQFVPTPRGTANGSTTSLPNLDSHILIPEGSDLTPIGVIPQEDNNVSQGPLSDVPGSSDFGLGSYIKYVGGLLNAQSSTLDLGYIVVPNSSLNSITIEGAATELGNPSAIPFSVPNPPLYARWTGNQSNSWDTGTNWYTDAGPATWSSVTSSRPLIFSQDGVARTNIVNSSPKSVPGMTFLIGGYTISGSSIDPGNFITANGNASISSDLTLGSHAVRLEATAGATLTLNGAMTGTNVTVTIKGSIVLGGASTYTGTTTLDGAQATLSPGASITGAPVSVKASTFTNNGTVNANVAVTTAGFAKGSGAFNGNVSVLRGGAFSPGNSPGTTTSASATFAQGGTYLFELSNAAGTSGVDFDRWNVTSTLDVTAETSAADRFVIALASLDAAGNPAPAAGFDPNAVGQWLLLHADGGITSFDPAQFTVDTSAFLNPLNGGTFGVTQPGNDLLLTFTPVPEPSTAVATSFAAVALLAARKRRSRR